MSRQIICEDALKWLRTVPIASIPNVVTGICDMDEIGLDLAEYEKFFGTVANLIFQRMDPHGYAIFIQTDRKYQRAWLDKSHALSSIAYNNGFKMIWHKIVLHREVDSTDLHRPTYAHMVCYSKEGSTGAATPDVIPVSKRIYKNGTPFEAAKRAVDFVRINNKKNPLIVDPFVGQGTIPAIANKMGLDAIGIDIDPQQCEKAEKFFL